MLLRGAIVGFNQFWSVQGERLNIASEGLFLIDSYKEGKTSVRLLLKTVIK